MKQSTVASTRLQPHEKEALTRLAAEKDRTPSWIIRKMIVAGLRKQELRRRQEVSA